jgi:hypothetical protein
MRDFIQPFRVEPGRKVRLPKDLDTRDTADIVKKEDAAARREAERAAKRQQDMIEDLGGGLIRGVFGTLFGSSGRRRR